MSEALAARATAQGINLSAAEIEYYLEQLRLQTRLPRDPQYVQQVADKIGIITWPAFIERACDTRAEVFLNGGWRGTKTHSADFMGFLYIIDFITLIPGKHLVWIIGPDYPQARPDFFNLQEWATAYGFVAPFSDRMDGSLHMEISLKGYPGTVLIDTKSANHPNALGAVGPKLILAVEAGQMSDEAKRRIRGRASTLNAPIIWNGTFENEEGRSQYVWFEQESKEYRLRPTDRRISYGLPIYDNRALFANCLEGENSIKLDPSLAQFCPDDNHGPAHSGIDPDHPDIIIGSKGVPLHPKVRELYEECRLKPTYWLKYYEGEPVGTTNPVYEWATSAPQDYLKPMPKELKESSTHWLFSTGGMDFGLGGINHPSAVCVVSVTNKRLTGSEDVWVRFWRDRKSVV